MIKRVIKFLILSFMFLSVTSPFINSTTYESSTNFVIGLLLIVAVASLIDSLVLSIPVQVAILIYVLQMYTNTLYLSFGDWLGTFTAYFITTIQTILAEGITFIHEDFGFALLGIVLIPLINIAARSKKMWKFSSFVIFSFFILLATYNKDIILAPMIQLLCGSLMLGLWNNYQDSIRVYWRTVALGVVVLSIISITALNYRTLYEPIHLKMITSTYGLRNNLSSIGFYRNFNLKSGNGMASHSGFSEDDSNLGGPLYLNFDPVFTVEQTVPTYWRLDTRYIYNGKGWSNVAPSIMVSSKTMPNIVEHDTMYSPNVTKYHILESTHRINRIPIPFGASKLSDLGYSMDIYSANQFDTYHPIVESIEIRSDDTNLLKHLEYTTYPTITSEEELRAIDSAYVEFRNPRVYDTSLITGRIRRLADEITRDEPTQYDKVKRIETYLRSEAGLQYGLMDVPYTPDTMDYVEHFLFDSKVGYCEHYATAMVLMLRAVEIPSRWAKGYAKGTKETGDVYQITNADAHTWPEVYFEGYGWVPFEPTPSFSIDNVSSLQDDTIQNPGTNTPQAPDTNPNPNQGNANTPVKPTIPQLQNTKVTDETSMNWLIYFGLVSVLILLIFRKKLHRLILTFAIKQNMISSSFEKKFLLFMKVLDQLIPKEKSQTLYEYLEHHELLNNDTMRMLVDKYERIIYGDNKSETLETVDIERMLNILAKIPWSNKSLSNETSVVE